MAKAKNKTALTLEERLEQALVPECEQPYKVPGNWVWTRVGNIAEVIMGQSPSGTDTTKDKSYIPLIGGAADMGIIYPSVTRYTKIPTKISKIGDIILCIRATLGRPIFSNGEYCLGRGVAAIRSACCLKKYLRYFYLNSEQYLYDNATGTTFTQVNSIILQMMPIPLPPLAGQQRIVNHIESLFAKLDKAKEKAQAALDSFEPRKAAILHKAFTGELTAKWRSKNSIEMDSWKKIQLQNVCEKIVCGKTPTGYISANGEIPYLKVYNISNNQIDFKTTPQFIPKEIHDGKLKSSQLKPHDVIMNIVGPPLRKIAIIPNTYLEWNMNQAIVRFRPKPGLAYKFLYYVLVNPETLDDVINATKGVVGQANISITQSRELKIYCPTIPEQQEIVRILDDLFAKEKQVKETVTAILDRINLIKKSILARAFRGELGTNDPTEESAVELLKQCLAQQTDAKEKTPKKKRTPAVVPRK